MLNQYEQSISTVRQLFSAVRPIDNHEGGDSILNAIVNSSIIPPLFLDDFRDGIDDALSDAADCDALILTSKHIKARFNDLCRA